MIAAAVRFEQYPQGHHRFPQWRDREPDARWVVPSKHQDKAHPWHLQYYSALDEYLAPMLTASQPGCMSTRGKRARAAPSMGTPTGRASYRDVLGAGEFRVIFAANVVSMLGSVVAAVALTVLVYQQTRSPALAASVLALSFLPYLLGGILLGAAADRLPARRVLVGCDLASAVLVACMVVPGMPVLGLLVLLFANGLIAPVYQGVRSALLPEILPRGPRYVLGRSLMRLVAQSAQIVGYGVGGLLLAILSPRGALAADALSFTASGVLLRFGTARRPAPTGRSGSMARDSLAG